MTMKNIMAGILAFMIIASSLPAMAVRGYKSLWIECEDNATVISGEYKATGDNNASGGMSVKLDTTKEGMNEIQINFALSYTEEYDVYVLGTPGNVGWASPIEWKLDNDEYIPDSASVIQQIYTTADSRWAGISWRKLMTGTINKGEHALSFRTDRAREQGDMFYNVLDSIVIVPKSWGFVPSALDTKPYDKSEVKINYVEGKISKKQVEQKESFTVNVTNRAVKMCNVNPKLYAEITSNGETVTRVEKMPSVPVYNWGEGRTYVDEYELSIPFNLVDGVYEIRTGIVGAEYNDGSSDALVGTITVGNPKPIPEKYKATVKSFTIDETIKKNSPVNVSGEISIEPALDFETRPYVAIWKDGLLYSVLESDQNISGNGGTVSFSTVSTDDIPDGNYTATLGVHYVSNEKTPERSLKISGADYERAYYYKPMSYGNYFSERTGKTQFWYINQAGMAYYNGEPYVPMGGMFVPLYIVAYDPNNPEENEKRWQQDKEDLDMLRASGATDLYINPVRGGNSIPIWVWQFIIDYLEETGWNYGVQMQAVAGDITKAEMYYPRATETSGRFESEVITKSGNVEVTAPKGNIQTIEPIEQYYDSCYVAINNETGEVSDSGIGGLKEGVDQTLIFNADVKIPDGVPHTVYFAPRINGCYLIAVDFADDAEKLYKGVEDFSKRLKCGDHFRLWIDLTENEMGIYNHIESARLCSDNFNELYEGWLAEKYKDIQALNEAWVIEPSMKSFEEASRMIPVYTSGLDSDNNYKEYYVDCKTGSAYRADGRSSVLWNDYLEGRDKLFMKFNNKCADLAKLHNDLPVVQKQCSVYQGYLINTDTVGGIDGSGGELYGSYQKVEAQSGVTVSHAEQFARTAWYLVTETNLSEATDSYMSTGNGSYPSEEYLNKHFDGELKNGAKGIFDFLYADRYDAGGVFGKIYSQVENTRVIPWYVTYSNKIREKSNVEKLASSRFSQPTYYFYPPGGNWWFNPAERNAVQIVDDNVMIKHCQTAAGNFVLPTRDLSVDTDIIFVNLNDGPYSKVFGPQLEELINNNVMHKKIVVLGFREDLGTIPSVDKYFTDKKVQLNDSETVQILKPTQTSKVIAATPDGEPYAMQDGDLYFVATSDLFDIDGEFYKIKHVDEWGITSANTSKPENNGFSDMKGHWAEQEVESLRKKGIAEGVGNNKFNPDANISRAEFTALIVRAMGYSLDGEIPDGVDKNAWYANVYAAAEREGLLIKAFKDNPDMLASREEMAAVAARLLENKDTDITFEDYDIISQEYRNDVKTVVANNIMKGVSEEEFNPKGYTTRAESAAVVNRLLDAIK